MNITPRERVLTALKHQQPDVTPWQIDLTIDAQTQTAAYLEDPNFVAKIGNHLAGCEDGYFIEIEPGFWRDQFGIVWNRTIDKDIGNVQSYLLPEPTLTRYHFPEPDLERNAAVYRQLIASNRDKFRFAGVGFSMFERAWTLRGMENLLSDMILNPQFVDALLDTILEYNLKVIDHLLQFDFDCVRFGDDWGQQIGVIMGPKLWRRFIKPRVAAMYARAKQAGKYVMQHSCGAVQELFPDLIDMGLDIFNTFQPEVMDVAYCKREYGRHLTFYGGISTQQVLPRVGPVELRRIINEMIALIGKDGGYIVAPTHGIPRDVPPENIVAFIETVRTQQPV
ncbi:MAG: uroporphyrinogen decarboxylase [Chloroflexi bacterium]|nr:uroporphyrinogen decarboxylase [Chloroflexota bacterium]